MLTGVDILACLLDMMAAAVDVETLDKNQLRVHYMVVGHIVQVHQIPCLCQNKKKLHSWFFVSFVNIIQRFNSIQRRSNLNSFKKSCFTDAKALS